MPGAKVRGSDRGWRCHPADFENEGSTAFTKAPFSLGILNMGKFLHGKIKVHAGVSSSLAFCLPLRAPTAASEGTWLPWDCPGGGAKFCFWVTTLGDTLSSCLWPKGNWMQFCDVELQRRGRIFFPRMAPHREAFSRDPCSHRLSLTALFFFFFKIYFF